MSTEFTHFTTERFAGTTLGVKFSQAGTKGAAFQWALGGVRLVALLSSGWVEDESGQMFRVSEFLQMVNTDCDELFTLLSTHDV